MYECVGGVPDLRARTHGKLGSLDRQAALRTRTYSTLIDRFYSSPASRSFSLVLVNCERLRAWEFNQLLAPNLFVGRQQLRL